jgi:hypothetical protein
VLQARMPQTPISAVLAVPRAPSEDSGTMA